jgi:hypothetical protein
MDRRGSKGEDGVTPSSKSAGFPVAQTEAILLAPKPVQVGGIAGGFALAGFLDAEVIFGLPALDATPAVAGLAFKGYGVSKFILLKSPTCCV